MTDNWFPVIQVDPNGPWRVIDGVECLVASIRDPDLAADFFNGEIKRGQYVIEFQPNEPENGGKNEYGWGNISRLVDWADVRDTDSAILILAYLARPYSAVTISDHLVLEYS
jgi:hypothetical protein